MTGSPAQFHRRLLSWYERHRRDLPWRVSLKAPRNARPDPYYVLVSEAMLQQTQVATVIPYFQRFLSRFPAISDLAQASEQEVLRLWQGLGYYSRARNLHATAKIVATRYDSQVPSSVEELMGLPGIGRYTAGAIASLAFEQRAPILDGNVARVLCRLDGVKEDPQGTSIRQQLWRRAEEILPQRRVGDFNSGLMELGATICTSRSPKCLLCPVREHCVAQAAGIQEQIPPTRKARPKPIERRWSIGVRCGRRWLIEQRPPTGRWAGMWQFITMEAEDGKPTPHNVQAHLGLKVGNLSEVGSIAHELTHRRYEFAVYSCQAVRAGAASSGPQRRWVELAELSDYPLPRPQQRIAALLSKAGGLPV